MPEFSSSTYSATDASNTSASPNGAPEGMNPSGVNDTIRALIGATKRFWQRTQTAGGTFGGSTDAYTVTYTPVLAAYVSGERYSFVANADNTGTCTLDINSRGAKTIKKVTSAGKVALAAGDIKNTQPVTVEYDGTDMIMVTPVANSGMNINSLTVDSTPDLSADYVPTYDASAGSNKKVLLGNVGVPSGTVMDYAGSTEPSGWLFCYGQAISRTTYAALFAVVGTTYGTGDGSTTFNLPDLRGRVVAGRDNMGGTATNRLTSGGSGITGTTLGASGGTETHVLTTAQMPSHAHNTRVGGSGTTFQRYSSGDTSISSDANTGTAGSDQAHQNTQPTFILNKIIKT